MIKNDKVALVTARMPGYHTRILDGLVRALCRLMNADVDFVPYKFPSDIVPICIFCTCGQRIYVRATLYNEEQSCCPHCQGEYTVWTDGAIARYVPRQEGQGKTR